MDERPTTLPPERPSIGPAANHEASEAQALADPRALTILTTEHWSLLSGRSLVYNEAFSRAGMFLSFLAATLVALGLMSGAMGFNQAFLVIAALAAGAATRRSEKSRATRGFNRRDSNRMETMRGSF